MRDIVKQLMESRGGISDHYNGCPKYITLDACRSLLKEAGANPASGAVGTLGDVLENFALLILKDRRGKAVSISDIENKLSKLL